MIDRQDCYNALFKLKRAGIDVSAQLELMQKNKDIPRGVIEFLRENSPQFQFYRYIQKYQKALAENILDYQELDNIGKLITCSSFITRVMIAIKYKNLDESLIDDLNVSEVSEAINIALTTDDFTNINNILDKHCNSLRLFYKSNKKLGD